MSTVSEILAKQAAFITGKAEVLQMADLLEAQAKLLRSGANAPVKLNFMKEARDRKEAQRERFAAALKSDTKQKIHGPLGNHGWQCGINNDTTMASSWGHPGKPGYQVKVSGGKFSVVSGQTVVQPSMAIEFLDSYLNKFKKEHKL